MSQTTDFIEKLTEKLRHDRELRLDISHELQTHLDEAIEEYKASDYDEEAAITQAIKDMGDAEELADDLWQSNRNRMKLRAWCWWIARLSLLPACVVATIVLIITGIATVGGVRPNPEEKPSQPMSPLHAWLENRMLAQMSPSQRLIAYGDPQGKDLAARWKPLRDAYPNEPLYQLNYLRALCLFGSKKTDQRQALIKQAIDRGRELDPNNGIYDLLAMSMFLPRVEQEDDLSRFYELPGRDREKLQKHYPQQFKEPVDIEQIRATITQLQQVVDHPYITLHSLDMLRHRMAQMPPSRSMREYFKRVMIALGTQMPNGGYHNLNRFVCAAALQQANAGHVDEALAWLDLQDQLNAKLAASSDTLLPLLVAISMSSYTIQERAFVYDIAGMAKERDQTLEKIKHNQQTYDRIWGDRDSLKNEQTEREAGFWVGTVASGLPGYEIDFTPFRMAEYIMLDRGMLTGMLVLLVMLAGACSLFGVLRVWLARESESKPVLLWPGMFALFKVLFLSVILPVVCFMVLAMSPKLGRQWGMNHNDMAYLCYFPLWMCLLLSLWGWGTQALRQRAMALGLAVPVLRSRWIVVWYLLSAVLPACLLWVFIWLKQMDGPLHINKEYTAQVWLVFELSMLFWAYFLIALEIVWLNGSAKRFAVAVRAMWLGLGLGVFFVVLFVILFKILIGSPRDHTVRNMVVASLGLGLLVSLLRLGKAKGRYPLFTHSLTRSFSVYLTMGGLLLATTVGTCLHVLEAHYARKAMDISPVFVDLEIPKSNARLLQEQYAKGESSPPRMLVFKADQ